MSPAVARRSPCDIRHAKTEDLPFVIDTWAKHAYGSMRIGAATRHVRALLSREGSRLAVAHVPGEPDSLLGWAALELGEPLCLHYVYVRNAGREQGIATRLLASLRDTALEYSHEPPEGIANALPKAWRLNLKRAETT